MTIISNESELSDGIYGQNATYSTARSTSTAIDTVSFVIGQRRQSTTNYYCYRGFLRFDTSLIPDNATITKVNLTMAASIDNSTNDFDLMIQEQDWSPQYPIAAGTREAAYDGCLAEADSFLWRSTSGISVDTVYTSNDLTPEYVSKTGYTYYSLISSRDISASAPGASVTEYLIIYKHDAATKSYRPTLVVEYTVPSAGVPVTMISEFGMI